MSLRRTTIRYTYLSTASWKKAHVAIGSNKEHESFGDARIVSKKSQSVRNPFDPFFLPCGSFRSAFEFTFNGIATHRVVSANIELYNYWHSKRRGRYRDARHRPTNVNTYTSQCVKIIISLRLHGKRNVTTRQSRDETPRTKKKGTSFRYSARFLFLSPSRIIFRCHMKFPSLKIAFLSLSYPIILRTLNAKKL